MEGLFNPISILLHILNALILFFGLYYLLHKPVHKFMEQRRLKIVGELETASQALQKANISLQQAKTKNQEATQEAGQLVIKGSIDAKQTAQGIIDNAHKDAQAIIDKAHKDAQDILDNAVMAMSDDTAALSVSIASKILSREISQQDNQRLIDDFLKKVG